MKLSRLRHSAALSLLVLVALSVTACSDGDDSANAQIAYGTDAITYFTFLDGAVPSLQALLADLDDSPRPSQREVEAATLRVLLTAQAMQDMRAPGEEWEPFHRSWLNSAALYRRATYALLAAVRDGNDDALRSGELTLQMASSALAETRLLWPRRD